MLEKPPDSVKEKQMKKIGILFGQERSFPEAIINRINQKAEDGITAEAVKIDLILQNKPLDYAVIIDRISQDVPFYRAALKNAAATGTAVINNPFWWSADEKFFNNVLAEQIGVPVPKTALIPSRQHPTGTTAESFSNLTMPLDWDSIFNYVGFPAYMKPFDGGGWRDVYKLHDKEDFFSKHAGTEQLVMLLQEEIIFDEYYRCYCIGGKHVKIMQYDPRNPHHLRYAVDTPPSSTKLLKTIEEYVIKLCTYLGYDFNTVEFAVRDGIPIAIDFCNPAPDADLKSVGEENFEWVVETSANYAIERAKAQIADHDNLTWGEYIRASVEGKSLSSSTLKEKKKAAPVKKPTAEKSSKVKKIPAKKS
ncbi:ATP-grasp domain-containing protein [Pedobacter sp. AW1-32]|uniref:ATP-grasp domain-containing protein n=1 Tax=Pedobacter sp. AW1-32 TaxID=3383026 RepID=UPI003FEF1A62